MNLIQEYQKEMSDIEFVKREYRLIYEDSKCCNFNTHDEKISHYLLNVYSTEQLTITMTTINNIFIKFKIPVIIDKKTFCNNYVNIFQLMDFISYKIEIYSHNYCYNQNSSHLHLLILDENDFDKIHDYLRKIFTSSLCSGLSLGSAYLPSKILVMWKYQLLSDIEILIDKGIDTCLLSLSFLKPRSHENMHLKTYIIKLINKYKKMKIDYE